MSQVSDVALEDQVRDFAGAFVERIEPLELGYDLAWWKLATTGSPEHEREMVEYNVAYTNSFLQPGEFQKIEELHARRAEIDDPLLRRQLEVLRRMFAANQQLPEHVERVAELEAELEATYNNFRGKMDGRELSDNEILELLKSERDSATRRGAWQASKQIGAEVAERVLQLVELRNEAARLIGYRDYYARSLDLQEIDEGELFQILDNLERQTREPFARLKAELDAGLAARFGVPASELRPWHYADPFFQEPPHIGEADLDQLFSAADVQALTLATFDGLGLDIRDILDRSDLFERPGKNQHAFCTMIGRNPSDVRVLCNVRPNAHWMSTSLHEFGHAVYDKALQDSLPWLLRSPAHTSSTEAIAMLMGRLSLNSEWLLKVLGKQPAEVEEVEGAARDQQRLGMLIFVRWGLVMAHFERDLYGDPRRPDLNKLWWEYVQRFQMLKPEEGREAPDWASKIHIATAPVYYHNYLLGELTASQLQYYLEQEGGIVLNPGAGSYLVERMFKLGARYTWNETLAIVTGEHLNPTHFVRQFVGPGEGAA